MHVFDWPRPHLNDDSACTRARSKSKWPSYALTVTTMSLIMVLIAPGSARADDDGGDYGGELDTYDDDSYDDETDTHYDGMDSEDDGMDSEDDGMDSEVDVEPHHGLDSDHEMGSHNGPLYDISPTDDPGLVSDDDDDFGGLGGDDADGTGGSSTDGNGTGGHPTDNPPEEPPADPSHPMVKMTREQAAIVRATGIYVDGILRDPTTGMVIGYTHLQYDDPRSVGSGTHLGPNPFSEGTGGDDVRVRMTEPDPDAPGRRNGWTMIDPVNVPTDPIVREALRSVLYREVRALQTKIEAAEREMQRNQQGYHSTKDASRQKGFALGYDKAKKESEALKAGLPAKQLHLALLEDNGSNGN